jgi:hypothetical protein
MSADPSSSPALRASSSPALRASDADRDRVIEVLRAAVGDGRLDPAEFDERRWPPAPSTRWPRSPPI